MGLHSSSHCRISIFGVGGLWRASVVAGAVPRGGALFSPLPPSVVSPTHLTLLWSRASPSSKPVASHARNLFGCHDPSSPLGLRLLLSHRCRNPLPELAFLHHVDGFEAPRELWSGLGERCRLLGLYLSGVGASPSPRTVARPSSVALSCRRHWRYWQARSAEASWGPLASISPFRSFTRLLPSTPDAPPPPTLSLIFATVWSSWVIVWLVAKLLLFLILLAPRLHVVFPSDRLSSNPQGMLHGVGYGA